MKKPVASPTGRLLAGLAVTLAAVGVFSFYALRQIRGLEDLQTRTVERNRKDSLQLLRIQNDLNEPAWQTSPRQIASLIPAVAWPAIAKCQSAEGAKIFRKLCCSDASENGLPRRTSTFETVPILLTVSA